MHLCLVLPGSRVVVTTVIMGVQIPLDPHPTLLTLMAIEFNQILQNRISNVSLTHLSSVITARRRATLKTTVGLKVVVMKGVSSMLLGFKNVSSLISPKE